MADIGRHQPENGIKGYTERSGSDISQRQVHTVGIYEHHRHARQGKNEIRHDQPAPYGDPVRYGTHQKSIDHTDKTNKPPDRRDARLLKPDLSDQIGRQVGLKGHAGQAVEEHHRKDGAHKRSRQ